jgi:hypothetical protein
MRCWQGVATFIKVGRSYLEINYGQMFWLDADGVWIDTIRATVVDPLLVQHSVSRGLVTRSAYMTAVRERARQLCPAEIIQAPIERVRFYRPS